MKRIWMMIVLCAIVASLKAQSVFPLDGSNVGIGTNSPGAALTLQGDRYATFGPNSTWGATLRVGGNGNFTSDASVVTTNGNLHLDAAPGNAMYLNYYRGTDGIKFGNGAMGVVGNITPSGTISMNGNGMFGGRVGIGTTNPMHILDVTGTGGPFTGSANANSIFVQDHTNYRGVCLGYDGSDQIGIVAASTNLAPSQLAFWNYGASGWKESMRITSSGNVGIGTTSPGAMLDVTGSAGSFSSSAGLNSVFVQDHTNYRGVYLGYDSSDQIGIVAASTNLAPSQLAFWNYGASGWKESMRITSSGNVGIGTTSPTAKLTIGGTGDPNPNTASERDYNGLNITFKGENAAGYFNLGSIKMVQGSGYYVDAADMVFSTSFGVNNEKMRITREGNVSIGTSDPHGYKLAVNGTVIAESVTVKLHANWPDYVFHPTYHLLTLTEVKTYIDQNHHLPEMPSEKEVADKGIDLCEMNKLLVKKVEELTLYLIEKDKTINNQQEQISTLSKQMQEVMKKLL